MCETVNIISRNMLLQFGIYHYAKHQPRCSIAKSSNPSHFLHRVPVPVDSRPASLSATPWLWSKAVEAKDWPHLSSGHVPTALELLNMAPHVEPSGSSPWSSSATLPALTLEDTKKMEVFGCLELMISLAHWDCQIVGMVSAAPVFASGNVPSSVNSAGHAKVQGHCSVDFLSNIVQHI